MSPRVYEKLSRRPAAFRHMTGMTVVEFDGLYRQAEPALGEGRVERLNLRPRQRAIGAGGQFKNNARDRLLMALFWLRVYPTYDVLGFLFDLDKSNVCRNLHPALAVLRHLLGDEIAWPNSHKRKKMKMDQFAEEFADVIAIVDATEQPTQRPKEKGTQKIYYSGKKKRHTLKHQLTVTREGKIIHIGQTAPGARHDRTMFADSGVGDRLQDDEACMGDKGYQGIQHGCKAVLPDKKPKGKALSAVQRARNRRITQVRIVVEHTIGRMKTFQVLAQTYRHPRESHDEAFEIVAALTNRQIRKRLRCAAPA
jgi:hypothetical protein